MTPPDNATTCAWPSASPKPRRILLVMDHLGPGGAEMVGIRLADALNTLGHKVVLAQLDPKTCGRPVPPGIRHECWHIAPVKQAAKTRWDDRIRKHVARLEEEMRGKFDLILLSWQNSHVWVDHFPRERTWLWNHGQILEPAATIPFAPWSGTWWNNWRTHRKFLRRSNRYGWIYENRSVVSVVQGALDAIEGLCQTRFLRTAAIPNPIFRETLLNAAQGPPPLPGNAMVWAGRFSSFKQPDHAIRAFAQSGWDGHLWMLGNGKLLDPSKRLAKELGLADRIHFPGFVQDVPRWIAHSRGLLMTSAGREGLPTVLCEAITLGKPCVSYDCDFGPREILTGPLAEGLVPVNDIPAMARALRRMADDPILPSEEAVRRYDAVAIARRFLALNEIPFHKDGTSA